MDVILLIAGGLVALIAGGLVAFLSPGRIVSLLAATALALVGLVQFGLARAVYESAPVARLEWFENSAALGLAVSAVWVFLAVSLGRGRGIAGLGAWRAYLVLQGGLALAAIWLVATKNAPAYPLDIDPASFPLRSLTRWIVTAVLLNLVIVAANFEATHLSLSRRQRRAFRPGLIGVLLCAGFYTYLAAASLFTGKVPISDLSIGAVPITLLSLLLSLSLVRGRIAQVRVARERQSFAGTTSLLLASGFLIATAAVLAVMHAAGVSFGRALWLLACTGVVLGLMAFTISNRLRRRLQHAFDPVWYDPRVTRRALAARVVAPLEEAATLEMLVRLIPDNARELAGVEPVTLFLAHAASGTFRAETSTISPGPRVVVGLQEPLAIELRRARRPIRLRGRPDDLEYVSIYVENGAQLEACSAACAIPLFGEEDLIGFLLCGAGGRETRVRRESLALLHLASRRYAAHMERLFREAAREPTQC
jgi:hypothetical protein